MDAICKAALLQKAAELDEGELALINAQALRPLGAEEVFTFRLAACDNQVDRDQERFTDEALEEMSKLYVGKPVLRDHRWANGSQTARVYAAGVEQDGEVKRLVLRCYMPRTDKTADTITAMESGIIRECSVGVTVGKSVCSICGANQVETICRHFGGREYNGQVCHFNLGDVRDAYSIKKRGGYMVVTNELLADSDNNIVAVVQRWLADHDRITANKLILDQIHTKTAQDLGNLDGILKAWVSLGSVFRPTSHLITNDDGLLWLGTLKDGNGRYLLTPNPADPHQLRLVLGPHTLPIKTYDNLTIPTEGGKTPMLLGDLKEGIHFWDRQQMSILVSNVASVGDVNAFEQDLTLWRGLLRNDCTTWDDEAFINGYIKTGVTADTAGGTGTGGKG